MKYLTFLFVFVLFACDAKSPETGIEIYAVKGNCRSPKEKCNYCFDFEAVSLSEKPLLEEVDMEYFDWDNQQIKLNDSGKEKLEKIKIALSGMPVVMVLNGKRIYGFWFWDRFSSFGCDRIYTYPNKDFKIKFGLPANFRYGKDPRFNEALEKYVFRKYN